jgi:D-alanyl-D-alanine carboxypeptidase/D-alanyl-D-alanine-endopeptidase (penicillin-binding protein 4)
MKFVVALVAVACLAAGAAWAAVETDAAPAADATPHDMQAVTPLLSARRVPDALLDPRRDAAAVAAVSGIIPQIPGQSCLVVAEGDRVIVAHNPDLGLIPASTQKLLVGSALLSVMDPDATFDTTAVANAAPTDGVIAGDLVVVGGGDPLLSTDAYIARQADPNKPVTRVEDLADAIAASGVTRIEGSVVGDGSRYDDIRDIPSWPQRYRDQVQSGPLSGLGINDGLETFTPTEVAQSGGVPAADPPAHAAEVLTNLLRERGVTVVGEPRSGVAPAGTTPVATISSPPARTVVAQMLRYSDNTTAELLTKELAVRAGTQGSTFAGLAALEADLAATGIGTEGVALTDGSGLDPGNRTTCRTLAEVLELEPIGDVLDEGLAVAGQSGTLQGRMVGTAAAGNLRGKTGSLRNVSALAGEVDGQDGRTYTFAYISNVPEGEFVPDLTLQQQSDLGVALATLAEVTAPPEVLPQPAISR